MPLEALRHQDVLRTCMAEALVRWRAEQKAVPHRHFRRGVALRWPLSYPNSAGHLATLPRPAKGLRRAAPGCAYRLPLSHTSQSNRGSSASGTRRRNPPSRPNLRPPLSADLVYELRIVYAGYPHLHPLYSLPYYPARSGVKRGVRRTSVSAPGALWRNHRRWVESITCPRTAYALEIPNGD